VNTVRFGIIGFGRFAERAIAPAIRATPGAALVAIQKRSPAEAQEKARECGVPLAFATAEDLVASPEVDAVFIVSANSTHCRETLAAAAAGKHVLVEKPMAMNCTEAERMIVACRNAGVRLMVGHMVRLSPVIGRIRDIIGGGGIGTVSFARADFMYDGRNSARSWLYDLRVAGGGPVFDVGVHCLDTIRAVLRDEVESVQAQLAPRPTEERTETTAQIGLRFKSGVIGSIYCSFASGTRRSFIEIVGTDGLLSAVDFTVSSRTTELVWTRGTAERPAETVIEPIMVPNLYVEEISRFVNSVRKGETFEITGENGLANQRVLDAVMRG